MPCGDKCSLTVLVYFTLFSSLLAQWQFTRVSQSYSLVRFLASVLCFHKDQDGIPRQLINLCTTVKKKHLLITDLKCTSSLRNTRLLLAKWCPIRRVADSRLSFILHAITGLHRLSFTHLYGLPGNVKKVN